jgi:GH15 family glucan-1,4-alpha-glucosidase
MTPTTTAPREATLDLGLVGNGTFGALIDKAANVVWACYPSFDGDPAFCALLSPKSGGGQWAIEVDDTVSIRQEYLENTAVLRTVIEDSRGGSVEVTDFCPRWRHFGRIYKPVMLIRRLRPLRGTPRIRVRMQPLSDWGERVPERTWGSNHMRWLLTGHVLRLTTDAPLRLLRDELPFVLDRELRFVLGPDETLTQPIAGFVQDAEERTTYYWREWARYLSIPLEWQDAVIRSAITLKLCQYEDTGGIIAALTTSIPEAAHTSRNWDYRYCWLRDAAFVVRVLNRLGATRTMEEYIRYAFNLAVGEVTQLQPVYGIGFETELHEDEMPALAGYRGMGPVRRGNLAWKQVQHDVYGSVVLASTQLFFDQRLDHKGDLATLERLEPLGERAWETHDQPDAGLWEFRGRSAVHTYSSMMCWAACDRLAKVSTHFNLADKARRWRERADAIRATVLERAWNAELGHFVDAFDGERLDASLLLMADFGFIAPDDPRFVATVEACGRDLRRGHGVFRYVAPDDFGAPETTFTICTFWYVEALAMIGRREEARALFESVLQRRNHLGLLSEDMAVEDGALWGNFPQTYSHVGLIGAAMQLSRPWQEAT